MELPVDQRFIQVRFFEGVPTPDVIALAAQGSMEMLRPGDAIVANGDTVNRVHFVLSGEVRTMIHSANGRSIRLRAPAGGLHGIFLINSHKPAPVTIEAVRPSAIVSIRAAIFQKFLDAHPSLYPRLLETMAAQFHDVVDQFTEISTLGVLARLSTEILRLSRQEGREDGQAIVVNPPSQTEIAQRINTNRETVSREMSRLLSGGVVVRNGESLLIPDVSRLKRISLQWT